MTHAAPPYPVNTIPPPRAKSGLVALRDHIASYFANYAVPVTVAPVGLKYRSFNLNQTFPGNANRIVVIPGEFDGNLSPAPRKGGAMSRGQRQATSVINPRELALWERTFTLSIWSGSSQGNEEEAVIQSDLILEQTVRACMSLAIAGAPTPAAVRWSEVTVNAPPVEGMFGIELLVGGTLLCPMFDVTLEIAQATVRVPPVTYSEV